MITIPYAELPGSPVFDAEVNKADTAQRKLVCDWDDRQALMRELLGPPGEPLEDYEKLDPSLLDVVALRASAEPYEAKITGKGTGSRIAVYEKAIITVTYGWPEYEQGEDQEIYSESWEPTIEFITLDWRRFRWANATTGDPLKQDEAPGMQIRSGEYVLTRYSLSSIPNTAGLDGGCNSGSYTTRSLGRTFGAETLLFVPPTAERSTSIKGTAGWNVTFHMPYRASGWNKFFRVKTGAWDTVYIDGGAQFKSYPAVNFSSVWTPSV